MDNSISIAKGIAIILMVVAHAGVAQPVNDFIYMFHMPLFFFFSGYCFKTSHLDNFKKFTWNRVRGIYIPFVKYSLIFLLLHNVFFHLNIYNDIFGFKGNVSHLYTLSESCHKAYNIIIHMKDNEQLLGGYWFMRTLFFGSFIGYTLLFAKRKLGMADGKYLILSLVLTTIALRIPFVEIGIREWSATSFFLFGHFYKNSNWHLENKSIIIPLCALIVYLGSRYCFTDMLNLARISVIPYTIFALIGILMVFSISKTILSYLSKLTSILIFVGNNTLPILTWHFLSFKIVSLVIISTYGLPFTHLAEFPVMSDYTDKGWWFVYSLIGITLPLTVVKIRKL